MRVKQVSEYVSRDRKDVGWLKKNIPCRTFCPANTDIPGYIDAIAKGDYARSYEINRRDNIFPGILGRVCTRPCEPPCRHGYEGLGEPVAICYLKRIAWDRGRFDVSKTWKREGPTGQKVAIIGAGPAGLACANDLALWGHDVTLFEKEDIPGGMMTLGIPKFRLPKEVTDFDIESVLNLGIDLKTKVTLGDDIILSDISREYDAVVVALGTMEPVMLGIPGEEGEGVHLGLDFMMNVNKGNIERVPERVLVIGGGFTAVDCVRSSVRLGADEVKLIYRRTQAEMYIDKHELEEMEVEGIGDTYLVSPVEVMRNGKGEVEAVKCMRNVLGEPDESGRRSPVPVEGSEFVIETDYLIAAIGQRAEKGPLAGYIDKKKIKNFRFGRQNVFICGDVRTGASNIIEATAEGKMAADRVHVLLDGKKPLKVAVSIKDLPGPDTGRERSYDFIELQHMPTLELKERFDMKAEVQLGFDEDTSLLEARRCYLCDHDYQIHIDRCIYCCACIEAMPRKCIFLASDVTVDDEGSMDVFEANNWDEVAAVVIENVECIRCGNCIRACPVDCISVAQVRPFEERGE
jgi:NADPH-dependent glutamate synthase beta subunit-like oxidoreductase/ferredoxin